MFNEPGKCMSCGKIFRRKSYGEVIQVKSLQKNLIFLDTRGGVVDHTYLQQKTQENSENNIIWLTEKNI